MNLAVLLYEHAASNPDGLPDSWPSDVLELGDGTTLPGENWLLMTEQQFAQHKIDNMAAFHAWSVIRSVDQAPIKAVENVRKMVVQNIGQFVLNMKTQMAAENISLGVSQAGKTGTMVGLMSMRIQLQAEPYPFSINDTLDNYALTQTCALIDYFMANMATYEVPNFFTADRLASYKAKILAFMSTGQL